MNICGISHEVVDYLMGHVPTRKRKTNRDFTQIKEQQKLADKLERYVFDRKYTRNPLYQPLVISPNISVTPEDNIGFRIVAECEQNEILVVEINAACRETNDDIIITSPAKVKVQTFAANPDDAEKRSTRPILGR